MGKKMNQTEIKTVAKRILQEVNEGNKVYNETVINSKAYKDEIERIESKSSLRKIKEEVEKTIKLQVGTKYEDLVSFNVGAISDSKYHKEEKEIREELKEYKEKVLKKLYSEEPSSNWSPNKVYDNIIDEITIAQITITDIQLLINTIKAKLI